MPTQLGPHSFTGHADVIDYVRAGSPLVKLVDDFGLAETLLAINPHLLIVGRVSEPYDVVADARQGQTPHAAARHTVERQRKPYQRQPLIKIWEGPAEPHWGKANDPHYLQGLAWYAAYEAERLRLLADLGLRGVVGNFATGTPALPAWSAFLPAVDACEQFAGFLGLHEFASPWLWWLTGRYQTGNCQGQSDIPGEGDTGWMTLRYRKVYREILEPNGLGATPLLITECGLGPSEGVCRPMTSGAWLAHVEFWHQHLGDAPRDPIDYWHAHSERDPERYYAEQLMWYDRELQKDAYVRGAAIFTVGARPSAEPYDIGGRRVTHHLLRYIRTQSYLPTPAHATSVPPGVKEPASTTLWANQLINTGLEAGQAYFSDDTHERAVPQGWHLSYADPATPLEPTQTALWGRPITALINSHAVTSAARDKILVDGANYCWKIAQANALAPIWVRLTQAVSGLQRGQRYTFAVRLLPALGAPDADTPNLAAHNPLAGEARLRTQSNAKHSPPTRFAQPDADTGWLDLRALPIGQYTRVTLDVVAPADYAEVSLEVRARWAIPWGAWYVAELSLTPA